MKRTPMTRSQPLRATGPARATLNLRKCKVKECRQPYFSARSFVTWCSPACGAKVHEAAEAKKARREAITDKRQTRAQLEAIKTIPQLKKEAQREFNRFIRARDRAAGYACICCDKPLEFERIGGAVDAGHYRSTGSADHLRFDEDNCHAQRSDCNRYGAGRAVDYRIGLIRRLGRECVEALEALNEATKWSRDGLREIRDGYRRKAKETERSHGLGA